MSSRAQHPAGTAEKADAAVPAGDGTPGPLRWAALILVLEGLALVAIAGLLLAKWLGGAPTAVASPLAEVLMPLVGAAVLLLLARPIRRARLWARTPTALLQVFALPVAWGLAQSGLWLVCAAVAVPALAVLYLLVTPAARLAFHDSPEGR